MRVQIAAAVLIVGLLPAMRGQSPQSSFQAAYEKHRVFALRTDVAGAPRAEPFYKGAVAAEANRIDIAVRELRAVISAAPGSDQAYEAHDLLGNTFFRNGMYRDAFGEIRAALKQRPDASDAKQMLPVITALNNFPEIKVISLRSSTLQLEPKSIFLPIRVNGRAAEFFFDTGAGISLMGESEAKELGITAQAVDGTMGDASGRGVSGIRIALARDLIIGACTLRTFPLSS